MRCILRIGYHEYLLQDDRGLSTILNTLSRVRTIEPDDRKYDTDGRLIAFRHGPPPQVRIEPLPGKWTRRAADENDRETVECEVLPPERGALPAARARARLAGGRLMLEGGGA